jgi:hypothetical protein
MYKLNQTISKIGFSTFNSSAIFITSEIHPVATHPPGGANLNLVVLTQLNHISKILLEISYISTRMLYYP